MNAPAVGDPVLVLRYQRNGAVTQRARVTDVYIDKTGTSGFYWRAVQPDTTANIDGTPPGVAFTNIEILDHEGLRWAHGWDDETASALLAAWTLSL